MIKPEWQWMYSHTNAKLKNTKNKYPDAKKHQIISFIKSAIRILGYCMLPFDIVIATVTLIISEGIGILEELV